MVQSPTYLSFLAVVLVFVGCDGSTTLPAVTRLSLHTSSGWYLDVLPDGSGRYGFGSEIGMPFPAGTLDFQGSLGALQDTLDDERTKNDDVAVSVTTARQRTVHARYSRDTKLVAAMFDKARAAADSPRITELWNAAPPTRDSATSKPTTVTTRAFFIGS